MPSNLPMVEISEPLGVFAPSVLLGLRDGCIRIFDIGRGTNGYDASVRLYSNRVDDNGAAYIDLIAHRHHMRWGKLVDDTRPKGLIGWRTSLSSVVQYPVLRWSEFVQHPTETDVIDPTPRLYFQRKVKIYAEAPPFYRSGANAVGGDESHRKQKGIIGGR